MKKQSQTSERETEYVDYKDTDTLKKFLTAHGRIQSRKRTGVSSRFQSQLAIAIKRARYMGLIPYVQK